VTALLPTIAAAVGTFAVTNLDDIVVLTALFATAGRGGPSRMQVFLGQYLGMAALVAASAVAALGLLVVPERWVGLLGLVPIALGVRGLHASRHANKGDHDSRRSAVPVRGMVGVAGVTIANGADNISIYTPLFLQAGPGGLVVYVVVFALLVAVWCAAGLLLAGRQPVLVLLDRAGHWLVPVVFIVIGVVIVATSGLLTG
jgi:cadmium resistance protein CadD (predicted permease)